MILLNRILFESISPNNIIYFATLSVYPPLYVGDFRNYLTILGKLIWLSLYSKKIYIILMPVIKFDAVKKIWYEFEKQASEIQPEFEVDINKRLTDIFHIGDYYYYIFHCTSVEIEFTSDSVKEVLGVEKAEVFTIDYLLSIIHPEDLPYFYDFEKRVAKFFKDLSPEKIMKYKTSYDFRVRKADGTYIRIMHQNIVIQANNEGAIIRTIAVHTNISLLKNTNGSTLSFIGLDGEPSYHDVSKGLIVYPIVKDIFTKMEKKVLEQLIKGLTSKQIADILFISKLTVDGHRKNMLKKTKTKTTVELIIYAVQKNWVDENP